MKFAENKAFPHPVLSEYSDDYIDREFQAAFRFAGNADTGGALLSVRCSISDEVLTALVQSGQAEFVIETHCQQTLLRRICKSREADFQIPFAKGDLHGRVELNAFVVCLDDMPAFSSPNFNSEFGKDVTFRLEPGNVLAVQSPVFFWWDIEQTRPIGAVFQLVDDDSLKPGAFSVFWEEQKIQIRMRREEKRRFETARGMSDKKPTLLMSVYLPTLMETLRVMAEPSGVHEDKKWFRAIQYKLDEKGESLSADSDFLRIAQELFGMPLVGILPPPME